MPLRWTIANFLFGLVASFLLRQQVESIEVINAFGPLSNDAFSLVHIAQQLRSR